MLFEFAVLAIRAGGFRFIWEFVMFKNRAVRNLVAFAGGFGLMASAGIASAAVDASVATGLATVQADAGTLAGEVTPVVVFIVLAILGIRLVKKMLSKAV